MSSAVPPTATPTEAPVTAVPARSSVWDTWLAVGCLVAALYALSLVVYGRLPERLFDLLGFGLASGEVPAGAPEGYVLFVYGVLGSVLLGWLLLLLAIARGPLRRRERWAWRAVVTSVGGWCVVDTTFSLAMGSPEHAAFNVVFALAFGVPLVAIRRQLVPASPELSMAPVATRTSETST